MTPSTTTANASFPRRSSLQEEVFQDESGEGPGKEYSSAFDRRFAAGEGIDWLDMVDHSGQIPVQYNLEQVQNYFRQHPDFKFAAVLDGESIVGLCSERRINRVLSMRGGLGFAVYAKTRIARHMDKAGMCIIRATPVRDVLGRIMSRGESFFDDVILTDGNGSYLGLINARNLMLLQHRINHLQLEELTVLTAELNNNNLELEKARDLAVEATESKSSFLANMSHEIRTPLNGILGMIKMLMRTPLNPNQHRFAGTVLNSANALLTILNDILDFSKIEAGKMTLESIDCDIADVIEEVVQLLSERAREKKLELFAWIEPGFSTRVKADPHRIRQVILNLASNAIKFTEQGEVVIRVSSSMENGTHVRLKVAVSDTGIGISEEARGRLFGAFEQADQSTSRRYGGTGLGLAISKRLVALLGSGLCLESQLGKGSVFWFEWDAPKQTARNQEDHLKEPETDFWGLRILVVNGNASFTSYLGHHLQRWNTVYRAAGNGAEALEMAAHQAGKGSPFELIALDYRLPDMTGLELALRLNHTGYGPKPSLILFTSFQDEVTADQTREAGIHSLLTKPVKPGELRDAMLQTRSGLPLPARNARSMAVADPIPASGTDTPALHLLLVEDSPVNTEVALLLLEGWNHRVETAINGVQALERLREKSYDCVLMDCQMPEMDGYEATRAIRDPSTTVLNHDIYIIAMTANAMPGDREKCLRAGMNNYVGKPIDEKDLQNALLKAAEHSRKKNPEGQVLSGMNHGFTDLTARDSGDGDEPHFPEKLIKLFISETRSRLQDLAQALEIRAFKTAARCLHMIIGTAGNFKAPGLYLLAKAMEVKLHEGKTEDFAEEMAALESAFSDLQAKWLAHAPDSFAAQDEQKLEKEQVIETNPAVTGEEEPYFPARLINLFLTETETRLDELKAALSSNDHTTLLRTLHTIKGTAGNFRAHTLFHICSEFELDIKEGRADKTHTNLSKLENAFAVVKNKLGSTLP